MKSIPQQQQQIDLSTTIGIECQSCGNDKFQPIFFMRKASRFVTGYAQDAIVPVNTFACAKCGHVNDEFNPLAQIPEDQDA